MEGDQNNETVSQMAAATAAAAEPEDLPVPAGVEVAVGLEEKINHVGSNDDHGGVAPESASGGETVSTAKRKRGRPRKQPPVEGRQEFMVVPESSAFPHKRGRGRPKGSVNRKTLASLGVNALVLEGSPLTPHALIIQRGENIVQRICSFSQSAFESVCILSACGTVSNAHLQAPGFSGALLRYEGLFDIVSLNGSLSNNGKSGHINVQLANPDGSLLGGAVAGCLIAGTPTQLMIATFTHKLRKPLKVRQHSIEPSKANKAAAVAAVPLQTANGRLSEAEMNGLATVPPVSISVPGPGLAPAPVVDGVARVLNDRDVNYASPQPFDWNSLQP